MSRSTARASARTAVVAKNALSGAATGTARVLRVMTVTSTGRFLALAALIAAGLWFGARDGVLSTLGWGAVPAFAWLAVFLLLLTRSPGTLAAHSRAVLALFGAAAAAVGGLGTVGTPSDAFGPSMGGLVGAAIARYPLAWDVGGGTVPQIALGAVRIAAVVALSAAVMWPSHALAAARVAGAGAAVVGRKAAAGAVAAYVLSIAGGHAAWERLREYREKRAARGEAGDEPAAAATPEPPVAAEAGEESMVQPEPSPRPVPGADADTVIVPAPDTLTEAPNGFAWTLPAMELLRTAPVLGVSQAEVEATSQLIIDTLAEHSVDVSIGQVRSGPTVTMYGIVPGYGRRGRNAQAGEEDGEPAAARPRTRVRVDTILAREKDLALALASPSLRFEAPVPGESLVGIEVPNSKPTSVALRNVMETEDFRRFAETAELPFALGIGSGGDPVFADLTRMPHVLVAGATGSGKSVCINALLSGLLMVRTPADLRIVLIDPKRVELTPYDGIPHLYTPTVVEPDRTVTVLKAVVNEMMRRFRVLESAGTKNIASFNEKATTRMPYIVVAVDELADLMLFAANEVERTLVRLAQLGRATGVHLVVATQRPSVDVVTGLIKANFPSRVAFAVMSQVDSRTILDTPGADKLLGRGDMLFLPVNRAKPMRIQGAFLTDPEVEAVVSFWHEAKGPPMQRLEITLDDDPAPAASAGGDNDSLFDQAQALANARTQLSTSLLQRRLRIGYPRAARLMDELEDAGIVGPGEAGKPRVVIRND